MAPIYIPLLYWVDNAGSYNGAAKGKTNINHVPALSLENGVHWHVSFIGITIGNIVPGNYLSGPEGNLCGKKFKFLPL